MYFSAKGGKTGVTSSLLLSPFGPRPRLFDLINHSSWPEERCVQLDVEAFLLKKFRFVYIWHIDHIDVLA